MKRRMRFLAAFLCTCMLMTSNATFVLAAGVSGNSVEIQEETQTETESLPEETESVPVEESEGTSEETESAEEGSVGESSEEETPEETQTPGETETGAETPSETDAGKEAESGTAAEEGTETETETETEAEDETGTVTETETAEETETDESGISVMVKKPHEWGIDENGTLVLKSGEVSDVVDDLPEGVKTIPANIFKGEANLVRITIPTTVEVIEKGAFSGATGLTTVIIETGTSLKVLDEEVFSGCISLATITVPEGIMAIGAQCFEDCEKLTEAKLPVSLETLGERAFDGCTNLKKVSLDKISVSVIPRYAFRRTALEDPVFSASVTEIKGDAFGYCSKLGYVDFSKTGDLKLSEYAFRESGVTELKFSDRMTEISSYAFYKCEKLGVIERSGGSEAREILIGGDNEGVQRICSNAFLGCSKLSRLTLKASVAYVESGAFAGCTSLKTLKIENGKDAQGGSTISLLYDSFPANNGMVVYGYNGEVEMWAGGHKTEGVKFESLYPQYPLHCIQDGTGTITFTPTKARVGETVKVDAKLTGGYVLVSLMHGERTSDWQSIAPGDSFVVEQSDIDESNQRINIRATFAKKIDGSNLELDVVGDGVSVTEDDTDAFSYQVRFQSAWKNAAIQIKQKSDIIGNWAWKFAGGNSFVSVDSKGNLRALKKTSSPTVITATLISDPSVVLKLKCTVEADACIERIENFSFKAQAGERISWTEEKDPDRQMQIVSTSKRWLEAATAKKKTRDVTVTVNAVGKGSNVDGEYTWSSGDTRVATLASKDTKGNQNVLKICGIGETVITVTSKLAKEKEKPEDKTEYPSAQFIVRVVDMTPYIEESVITINPFADERASLSLVEAYGGTVRTSGIHVVKFVKNEWKEQDDDFDVWMNDGKVEIAIAESDALHTSKYDKTTKTYSLTDLYLKVIVEEDGQPYYIKMPTVNITNKQPKPTLKLEGKINKFYSAAAGEEMTGKITMTVNSPAGYVLDQAADKVRLENLDAQDKNRGFAENFEVVPVKEGDNSKLYLKFKGAENVTPVYAGYLVLKYQGYQEVKVKVTVPTANTKPALTLSSSVTAHAAAQDQIYEFQLLDNKKKPISLDGFESTFNYNEKSDRMFWGEKAELDRDKGVVRVKLPDGGRITKNTKAVINLKNKDWGSVIEYTLNIKYTKTAPKAVLGSSTIAINRLCYDRNETSVTLNQSATEVSLTDMGEFIAQGSAKAKEQAEKIQLTWSKDSGTIVAAIRDRNNMPADGTYTYKAIPGVTYYGSGTEMNIGALTVKVKIESKQPYIALKSSQFQLNLLLADNETAKQTFTWKNLVVQAGSDGIPDISGARVNGMEMTDAKVPFTVRFTNTEETVSNKKQNVLRMEVTLKEKAYLDKTTTYQLSGLKIREKDGSQETEVKTLAFKIKPINVEPVVTLKASGSINVLDPDSKITYTAAVKNSTEKIDMDSVKVSWETAPDSNGVPTENPEEQHFELKKDAEKEDRLMLVVKDGKASEITAQEYRFVFSMMVAGRKVEVANAKVKPTQKMPKLKLDKTSLTYYMGAANQTREIAVEPQPEKAGTVSKVKITDVVWTTKTSQAVQDAFEQPEWKDGKLILKLKNPALLKKGTTYNLVFAIQCENQLSKTEDKGTSFTVKVTVK